MGSLAGNKMEEMLVVKMRTCQSRENSSVTPCSDSTYKKKKKQVEMSILKEIPQCPESYGCLPYINISI